MLQITTSNSLLLAGAFKNKLLLFFYSYLDSLSNERKFSLKAVKQGVDFFFTSVHTFCKIKKKICQRIQRDKM